MEEITRNQLKIIKESEKSPYISGPRYRATKTLNIYIKTFERNREMKTKIEDWAIKVRDSFTSEFSFIAENRKFDI